jgi:hypothetical protein
MALKTMRFALKADPDLSHVIQQLKQIELIIYDCIVGRDYGCGVKAIYVGVVLVDAEHVRKFSTKKPVYRAGKYEQREAGLSIWFEDTLEFDVIPRLEDMRRAGSVEKLARTLKEAFQSTHLSLQRKKYRILIRCAFYLIWMRF